MHWANWRRLREAAKQRLLAVAHLQRTCTDRHQADSQTVGELLDAHESAWGLAQCVCPGCSRSSSPRPRCQRQSLAVVTSRPRHEGEQAFGECVGAAHRVDRFWPLRCYARNKSRHWDVDLGGRYFRSLPKAVFGSVGDAPTFVLA